MKFKRFPDYRIRDKRTGRAFRSQIAEAKGNFLTEEGTVVTRFFYKGPSRRLQFDYVGPARVFLRLVLVFSLVIILWKVLSGQFKAGSVNGSVRYSPAQEEELIEDRGRKAKKKAMSFMFEKLEVYQRAVDLAEKISAPTDTFPANGVLPPGGSTLEGVPVYLPEHCRGQREVAR